MKPEKKKREWKIKTPFIPQSSDTDGKQDMEAQNPNDVNSSSQSPSKSRKSRRKERRKRPTNDDSGLAAGKPVWKPKEIPPLASKNPITELVDTTLKGEIDRLLLTSSCKIFTDGSIKEVNTVKLRFRESWLNASRMVDLLLSDDSSTPCISRTK